MSSGKNRSSDGLPLPLLMSSGCAYCNRLTVIIYGWSFTFSKDVLSNIVSSWFVFHIAGGMPKSGGHRGELCLWSLNAFLGMKTPHYQ